MLSKKELIDIASRAKKYEPEALDRLFDFYFNRLRRYMYYRTGDLEKAEDLASETLTEAIEKIGNFKDRGGTIGAWLFGIARNMLARERAVEGKAEIVELDERFSTSEKDQPETIVLEKLSHEELYVALSRLPDEQREVILLRFIEGFDAKTVGKLIGKKAGAVRALQFRAIQSLKKIFEKGGVSR